MKRGVEEGRKGELTLRLFGNVRGDKKQGHTGQGTHGTRTHCAALAFGDVVFAGFKRPSPKNGQRTQGRGGVRKDNVWRMFAIYA